jgi:hypothetical protein
MTRKIVLLFIICFSLTLTAEEKKLEIKDYSDLQINFPYRQKSYNAMVKSVSEDNLIRFFVKKLSLDYDELVKKQKPFVEKMLTAKSYKDKEQALLDFSASLARVEFLVNDYWQNNSVLRLLIFDSKRQNTYQAVSQSVTTIKNQLEKIRANFEKYKQKYYEDLPMAIRQEVSIPRDKRRQERRRDTYCSHAANIIYLSLLTAKLFYDKPTGEVYNFVKFRNKVLDDKKEKEFAVAYCKDHAKFKLHNKLETVLTQAKTGMLKHSILSQSFQKAYKEACEKVTDKDLIMGCKKYLITETFLYSLSYPEKYKEVKNAQ